jgi:hypothetical protein
MAKSYSKLADKHHLFGGGKFSVVRVIVFGVTLECTAFFDVVVDDVPGHPPAGSLGIEGEKLQLSIALFQEMDIDHRDAEDIRIHSGEVFLRGEVDDFFAIGSLDIISQQFGNSITPETVEIFFAADLEFGPHL